MISDIYILATSVYKPFQDEGPFCDFIKTEFPSCIKDHLPKFIQFKSIEYKQDEVGEALLWSFIDKMEIEGFDELLQSTNLEMGYFHIQLESEERLERKELPSIEFVLQKMHEIYYFITTYFYYITESGLRSFVKMWTFESNIEEEEEGDKIKEIDEYTDLVDSYFYKSVVPEQYQAEIAKYMLLRESI